MTEIKNRNMAKWSAGLCNAAILLYVCWLMLPAVQTTGKAITGVASIGLFAVGVLLDAPTWKEGWAWLLARVACIIALPILTFVYLDRGGDQFLSFFVQNGMFWFPLVFCGYARQRGDARLWRWLKPALLTAVTITLLTSIGWLIEGMFFRGDQVYAYSRSLGYAEPGMEAYLKELMLRNIGGYDFVYAMVAALPLCILGMEHNRGMKRVAYLLLLWLQVAMIVLSQYTYAMLYAALILAVEIIGLLLRWVSRNKIPTGWSLVLGLLPFVLVWVLRMPLLKLASSLCAQAGLDHFAFSLEQLMVALQGGVTDENSRLGYYQQALEGFARSPLVGTILGGKALLSRHSDVLDVLSGMGILGGLAVCAMIWLMGRGSLKGLWHSADRARLCMVWLAVLVTATLGTVCYSREVMAVAALGSLLVLEGNQETAQREKAAEELVISDDQPDETI